MFVASRRAGADSGSTFAERFIATFRKGGTPIDLVWRRRKVKPLRLVVLLDTSGSMNLYTAFFVRFLHGVVDSFREAEAFVFHTRLAQVSPSLRDRNVARAVDRLGLMAQGIGGGTRIGESLATFNRWHARRVINSRTAVMIVSDGYDTGDPELLGAQMRRLRRRCRRIVWLNPLIGWKSFSPDARGMQAALPHIDLFAPAHNLESLAALEPYPREDSEAGDADAVVDGAPAERLRDSHQRRKLSACRGPCRTSEAGHERRCGVKIPLQSGCGHEAGLQRWIFR